MRKVLHIDLDAFFCSVEEILDPSLKGKAFATGGSPGSRSVITSCTYAARRLGIKSAMPVVAALKIYPQLQIIHGHYSEYQAYSKKVMQILLLQSPLFEQISIDEAFLDVTDLPQPVEKIAYELQQKIFNITGLPCSIGCASNKLVAKIATNYGKSTTKRSNTPMAIMSVSPGRESEFLAPQPVLALWGIGPKSSETLNSLGIKTIGDIALAPLPLLENYFGKYAFTLIKHAKGIDDSPVSNIRETKSVSNEHTFPHDVDEPESVLAMMNKLSAKVGRRLRKMGLSGKSLHIKIRYSNFETITRQMTLRQPTNSEMNIFKNAKILFLKEWKGCESIRLIGVGVGKLDATKQQLSLLSNDYEKDQQLYKVIDSLQEKFGTNIIKKGMGKEF